MKKRNLVYCNVDYIKAFVSYDEGAGLVKLSVNSNQIFTKFNGNRIEITKMGITDKFRHYFALSCAGISVGFIGLGSTTDKKEFIEITGQGLTLLGTDFYYFLMKKFDLGFVKYKRIDVCFDMEMDINYFYDRLLLDKFKTEDENFSFIKTKRNGYETLYFGKVNIKQNSYILNRVYNKLADTKKKGKEFLYDDKYKNEDGTYKEITRFETELREDLCKFYPFEVLQDKSFIFFRLVKSFYKYNPQFFHFLKDKDFFEAQKKNRISNKTNLIAIFDWLTNKPKSLYQQKVLHAKEEKERNELYGSGFIDDRDRKICEKIFVSQAKRLFRNGVSIERLKEILENSIEIK